jgi:hypothetical protein
MMSLICLSLVLALVKVKSSSLSNYDGVARVSYFCVRDCCSAESASTTVMAPVWVSAFFGLENLKFNFLTHLLSATPHFLSSLAYHLPLNLLSLLELLAKDRD